ncbi:hypothetical protein ACWDU9_32535 [Streptomyces cellulosae]
MVFVIALSAGELERIDTDLRLKQTFTKTVAVESLPRDRRPQITLLVTRSTDESDGCPLRWLGVVRQPRGEKVSAVDSRITVELLRECPVPLSMRVLLNRMSLHARHVLARALTGEVTVLGDEESGVAVEAIAQWHPLLRSLLSFLAEAAEPELLDPRRPEDASWQEQYDAARLGLAIGGVPPSRLAAWRRPADPHEPFLAGLIEEPYEASLIEHDARHFMGDAPVFQRMGWPYQGANDGGGFRCDIHVFEHLGRRIEVANVNATPVEARLGTDLIYYHEATQSFVLVQYKRLPAIPRMRWISVDKRLLGQLDRLERVAELSRQPTAPHEWRLGPDPCFVKLAFWPKEESIDPGPAPGMYLSVPYVRLLLNDEATRSGGGGRRLGYGYVDRYLTNTEFTELVKNGLVGTVGTTLEDLALLGVHRAEEAMSVVIAVERATTQPREAVKERHKRNHERGYDKAQALRLRKRRPQPPMPGQQAFPL